MFNSYVLPGRTTCWLALAAITFATGCVDSQKMIEKRREEANWTRLEEVDLGKFYVTLPPADIEGNTGVVSFHAFAQVPKRDRKQVEKMIESRGPQMRHELLMAVRQLSVEQLLEPKLTRLRNELVAAVNAPLPEKLVEEAGFYQFAYFGL